MTTRRRAYVAIGSNLGERGRLISEALRELRRLCPQMRASAVYESRPLGPRQPNFLNAVIEVWWYGPAFGLLQALQTVERRLGRRRAARWGPRTVDLDLLLVGNHVCRDQSLVLPHTSIASRPFVLLPLVELAQNARSPVTGLRYARRRYLLPATGMRRRCRLCEARDSRVDGDR